MVTVYPILRQHMIDCGVTVRELAAITNTNIPTLYMKMWGIKRWTLTDAVNICCFFNTLDAEHLFRREPFSFV
jgi:hypothetical protein